MIRRIPALSQHLAEKRLFVHCMVLLLVIIPILVKGQREWSLTAKSGISIPTEKIQEAELKTGYGAEGTLSYEITDYLSANAGWSWNKFPSTKSFAGDDLDFEETGYALGLQFNYPTTSATVTYMVGLGGLYHHLEIEDNAGVIIADSGHGFGTQIESGIIILLSEHFELVPYGRYRILSSDFSLDNRTTTIDLKYLSFGIGISWTL